MSILETDKIRSYYDKAEALRGISIEIEENETVGVLGRNGAGKTTLLKSIIGYEPPNVTSGVIRIHDEDVTDLKPYQIARRGVGFVPEEREVFPELTVSENLKVGKKEHDKNINWTESQIYETFSELNKLRESKAASLSGGEQQMLTIGRTLMGNPSILLLDEPSEGLAPQLVETVKEQIEDIKFDTTILLAEQNTKVGLELSDRVYVIEEGKIILQGDPDDLRGKEKFERRIAI